jgi:hypothetical protein
LTNASKTGGFEEKEISARLKTNCTMFPGNMGMGTAKVAKVKKIKKDKNMAPPRILALSALVTCTAESYCMLDTRLEWGSLLDEFLSSPQNADSQQPCFERVSRFVHVKSSEDKRSKFLGSHSA